MKKMLILLVVLSFTGILTACQPSSPSGSMLSLADRKAILAFSEAKVDNLMAGWNQGDYAVFSKDFSQDLLKSMTQQEFEKLRNDEFTGLGIYHSREVEGVVQRSDGSSTVIYYVVFDNDDEVVMRVTFQEDKLHQISGLQFER